MRRLVWVVIALAVARSDAAADGIFLNAKGQAQLARLEDRIKPARVERVGDRVFVRGRIVDAHALPRGYVVQLQPSWMEGTRQVWAENAVPFESDVIQLIGSEVDSHLDLQLMLSSRDERNPASPPAERARAPIGSPRWRARLARILAPDGPTEPAAETAALVHRGWLIFALIEEPAPLPAADPAGQAAVQRYLDAMNARFVARIKAGGADILHPAARLAAGADAMRGLVYGAARARRYQWADRDDPTLDPALVRRPGPGEGKDLADRILIVADYLCRLAETPETGARQRCPAGQPCVAEPVLQPTGQRIALAGRDARGQLLHILDNTVPGVPDVVAMFEPAARPVEPAEAAAMAVRVLDSCRPSWGHDAERLVRTLVKHAGALPATATAAQRALRTEARRLLIASLRPDLSAEREPELTRRRDAATEMRRTLSHLVMTEDPDQRAVARSIVLDGGAVNDVIVDELVDWLFAVATNPTAPEGGAGPAPRRATRRDAITMLMVLGTLADPRRPTVAGSHPVAQRIAERIARLRAMQAEGNLSQGQRTFLELLATRPGEADADAGAHVKKFAAMIGR